MAGPTGIAAQNTGRQAELLAALSAIALPEGGTLADSPRLGPALFDTSLEGVARVSFAIAITPPEAATFAPLRAAAQAAAAALPGIGQALVTLTAERGPEIVAPPPPPKLAGGTSPAPAVLQGVGAVIAVASGKGGVGKSTTTVNLALALRARGLAVGILDADIHGPSVPTLLGLANATPRLAADGRRLRPLQAWGISALSVGNLVDADTAMIWRGPMVTAAIHQLLAEVDWGALDVLLIDMPPGTGDAQLAVAQKSPLAGAVVVSTPQDLALIDARRGIALFRKLDVPVLGVVENMSQFICPDCGARHEIFGHGGAEAEARRIGLPFLGAVPLTMALRRSADLGRPLLATEPEGPVGQAMGLVADHLLAQMQAQGLTKNGATAARRAHAKGEL